MADRRSGTYAYSKSGTLCYSALFHAGRFDDLQAVLALDPKPYWHDQLLRSTNPASGVNEPR